MGVIRGGIVRGGEGKLQEERCRYKRGRGVGGEGKLQKGRGSYRRG